MRLKEMPKVIFVFFILSTILIKSGWAEEPAKAKEGLTIESIKQALRDVFDEWKAEKAKKAGEEADKLNLQLKDAIAAWVSSASKNMDSLLNQRIHADATTTQNNIAGIYADYFIRKFEFPVVSSDIIKTESLFVPYRASAVIAQKLFVELYHSSEADDARLYYNTSTRPVKLTFEYRGDKFICTNAEPGDANIVKGW